MKTFFGLRWMGRCVWVATSVRGYALYSILGPLIRHRPAMPPIRKMWSFV